MCGMAKIFVYNQRLMVYNIPIKYEEGTIL
jgi:hypothetical protein